MPLTGQSISDIAYDAAREFDLSFDAETLLRTVLRIVFLNTRLSEQLQPEDLRMIVSSGAFRSILSPDGGDTERELWPSEELAHRHAAEIRLLHLLQDRAALRDVAGSVPRVGNALIQFGLDKD